jgi:hypothetical membrane protein
MRLTRIAIATFVLAVIAGPFYTVQGYSAVANLISELAAQSTPRNFIMAGAFVALGAAIVADGTLAFQRSLAPFIAFGSFMALAGLFGHKPINPETPYLAWAHTVHGALATAAGISISVAFILQAFGQSQPARRAIPAILAVLCFALPLAMLQLPEVQGAIQRAMYLLVFAWLWHHYPRATHA